MNLSFKSGTLIAAVLTSGMVFLDSTIVTVALPRIGQQLPAHLFGVLEGQSYIYSGYLLTESAFLILAGRVADFYGRRRTLLIGITGFGFLSILCGIAPTMDWLIVFRLLEGVAGALVIPASQAIITATFSGEEQGRAFGIWSGASAGVTIVGPFLGGFLVDAISWRMAFLINGPITVVALWVIRRYVRESRVEKASGTFDVPGTLLTVLAITGLVFGTIYGQQRTWHEPLAFVALALGGAATLALPFWMLRSANPLVPPSLFRSRNFTVTNLSTLVIYAGVAVVFYYLPLFMQGTLRYTATASGVAAVPATLFLALFSARVGSVAARVGPRWFLVTGPAIMALGVLWFVRVPPQSQAWVLRLGEPGSFIPPMSYVIDFFPGIMLVGVGAMILVAPLTTTVMTSVPAEHAGEASAINSAISDVGLQLAGALIFVAITTSFYADLAASVPGLDTSSSMVRQQVTPLNPPAAGVPDREQHAAHRASTRGFHLAMVIGAVLLLSGAAINAVGLKGPHTAGAAQVISADPQWRRYCQLAPEASVRSGRADRSQQKRPASPA